MLAIANPAPFGATAYDANTAALLALQREWTRKEATCAERVTHLRTGVGGLNDGFALNAGTVFDDSASDLLFGGADLDWFFAGSDDLLLDLNPREWRN